MKKSLLVISMMIALAMAVGGCATKGDLEQVQAQEKMIGAKADQAAQDAQAAKAAAEAATLKANERERIADEKAKQADIVFKKSMKK
jgi:murein lipoprotein